MSYQWIQELLSLPLKKTSLHNARLAGFTSFKLGGKADVICFPSSAAEIQTVLKVLKRYSVRFLILGKGSNTIFTDLGYRGCIIIPEGDLKSLQRLANNRVKAGAGCMNMELSAFLKKNNLGGAEFLSTVPGTLGGAVFMNAGAHGAEIATVLERSECMTHDGKHITLSAEEHGFAYRYSSIQTQKIIILYAVLTLTERSAEEIAAIEKMMKDRRKTHQPINKLTWGSVFKNPPAQSAGQLIEACGLKGKGFGAALISPKHANFVENTNAAATFDDTLKTVRLARDEVQKKFGITLETEVRMYDETGSLIRF